MNISNLLSDEVLDSEDPETENPVFESWQSSLTDYLSSLQDIDPLYKPDLKLFANQVEINSSMRSILLDWIVQVCALFNFERETYYMTLSAIDRYLSMNNVSKTELQLIGLACLYIACKREESYPPRASDFANTTNNAFTVEEILSSENKILKSLKWQMCPGTFYNILNALLEEWDKFVLFVFSDLIQQWTSNSEELSRILITFKQKNKFSYQRFSETMQLLDVSTLDFNVYKFNTVKFISSILYLMVTRSFLLTNYEILPRRDEFEEIFEYSNVVERLLIQFLLSTVQISSVETLIGSIQFLESFRNFPFQTDFTLFANSGKFVKDI